MAARLRSRHRPKVLSVRVQARHRATLQRVMRDEGLRTESEATRHLIECEASRERFEDTLRRIRALHRGGRGRIVRAAEDHDAFLARVKH